MAPASDKNKIANLWVSRFIPLILVGIVAYVTWAVTVLIGVDYLLKPAPGLASPRHGAGIAVLFIYYLLLLFMAVCYLRLLLVVIFNPGYVERSEIGQANHDKAQREKRKSKHSHINGRPAEKDSDRSSPVGFAYSGSNVLASDTTHDRRPALTAFFSNTAFICNGDGRPLYCEHCQSYKPDRAHHCREVGRCVEKMDHFCPWVGGVISETSFKFFVQFVGWTAIFCIFNLILVATLLAEVTRNHNSINVHWIVVLAFAGLFGFFSAGMAGSSLQFAFINTTTIENLSRKSIVHQIAVYMPDPPKQRVPFHTITFCTSPQAAGSNPGADSMRTYAVLHTKPGENPWSLGPSKNFKMVMGDHWYDWFLPLRYSPSARRDRTETEYAMGPILQRMKQEAGLLPAPPPPHPEKSRERRERHRRKHRHKRHRTINEKVEQSSTDTDGPLPAREG